MLSFALDNQVINKLRELSERLAATKSIRDRLADAELAYIHRNVFISVVGASTRIENAILTDVEIDWIDTMLTVDARTTAFIDQRTAIQNKLSKDKERSIDEVAGCRGMMQLVYRQGRELFPLRESVVRGLHDELLRYYQPATVYRGRYKVAPNSVIQRDAEGRETPVLVTSSPGPITEAAMNDLIRWYNEVLPEHPWTIAVAVEFVFRFLAMHPFQDGNGRLGRALHVLSLLQSPHASFSALAPYLAVDRHIEKHREEYYYVLRKCSQGQFSSDPTAYDYVHFLNFMIKVTTASLEDFEFYRERYQKLQRLSPAAMTVLESFKDQPERRLQTKDIIATTDLPRSTINDALRMLVQGGFIQRYGQKAGTRYQLVF